MTVGIFPKDWKPIPSEQLPPFSALTKAERDTMKPPPKKPPSK